MRRIGVWRAVLPSHRGSHASHGRGHQGQSERCADKKGIPSAPAGAVSHLPEDQRIPDLAATHTCGRVMGVQPTIPVPSATSQQAIASGAVETRFPPKGRGSRRGCIQPLLLSTKTLRSGSVTASHRRLKARAQRWRSRKRSVALPSNHRRPTSNMPLRTWPLYMS
jgi:hypothetical protein